MPYRRHNFLKHRDRFINLEYTYREVLLARRGHSNKLLYQLTLIILSSESSGKIFNAIEIQNNESTNKGQMFSGILFKSVMET